MKSLDSALGVRDLCKEKKIINNYLKFNFKSIKNININSSIKKFKLIKK